MATIVNDEAEQLAWEAIEKIRLKEETKRFSKVMLKVLVDNIHKSGWEDMSPDDIYHRLRDELDELHLVVSGEPRRRRVANEAIDIANFAMFLWHWSTEKEEKQ